MSVAPQPRDALLRRVAHDQRRIDGANRNAGDPIWMQIGLRQRLIDTRLIGAKSAAALQDKGNPFERRPPHDPMRFAHGCVRFIFTGYFCNSFVQPVLPFPPEPCPAWRGSQKKTWLISCRGVRQDLAATLLPP